MLILLAWLGLLQLALALGVPNPLVFKPVEGALTLASRSGALPILCDSADPPAVHVAIRTFAHDVLRVTGKKPEVYADNLPKNASSAIIAATAGSKLMRRVVQRQDEPEQMTFSGGLFSSLHGAWESYESRVLDNPLDGVDTALVIAGSDRRGLIYALYALSEHMGVSPWYWWADVPIRRRQHIAIPRTAVHAHGPPTVKYRGFFFNDEQPVLWNWAKDKFNMGDKPPFQVEMYEKAFELVLRLKGNYMWPAMWASMFAVDGVDALVQPPAPGPNQILAERMGVVMGTSHHEPMSRNQLEFDTFGSGDWNWTANSDFLRGFWEYGAQRARECETVFTVGMRGNGDLPLDGANITAEQQKILRRVYHQEDISDVPQMWAMYKEVMGYFANGLEVPDEVTPMLSDDNWGNLMAVLPEDKEFKSGGGIYYHADYVGDPRDYKWINTVPLAKMWEQLNVALSFKTDNIWILNVGDLKMLEVPLDYFMNIAYDATAWPRGSLTGYLSAVAVRDFGANGTVAAEVADIMGTYSIYASRRKAELVDSETYSLLSYDEAERIVADWLKLKARAKAVHDNLEKAYQIPFYEVVYVQIQLQTNLAQLYLSAAKSNLYATQGRSAATLHAHRALHFFERDHDLTEEFNALLGGKWKHMLSQTHIGYQYWQMPVRNALPPVSFVSPRQHSYDHGRIVHVRIGVENCAGAWPGDNRFNCPLGYACADPTLLPMDRFGARRWVEVASGGPLDVNFTATPSEGWLEASPKSGRITEDGENDVRVWISVDWDAVPKNASYGEVVIQSDDVRTVITVPIRRVPPPPADFHGAVQGDGYVAIEAGSYTHLSAGEYTWAEIPYYGRTHSGLGVFPVTSRVFDAGKGPSVRYDFWATSTGEVEITLHLGPALNYILGQRNAFAIQLDDGEVQTVYPVPEAPLGALPADWETVVANEVREVTVARTVGEVGRHSVTVYGVSAGIVLERVLVDFGGIKARGYSYLGPPASVIV